MFSFLLATVAYLYIYDYDAPSGEQQAAEDTKCSVVVLQSSECFPRAPLSSFPPSRA